ncbi:MAG TPA: hypothetical protein VK126_04480 [Nitrososphaerales archaeon]|nr:hypothetical protein [Nitrososphaerales archaeon]
MRKVWRIGLALGAASLITAGVYYISYGATYYGVYYSNGKGAPFVVFSDYPIWSPPSWNEVNYSAPLCSPSSITTYTPQSPPPSCSYPPAGWSADYSHPYGGAILLVLGALAAVVAARSREMTQ